MKKYFFTTLFFAFIACSCFAQQDSRTSIGVDAGFPVGSSADDFAFAIGGSLKIENPVGDRALITLSMGYTSLSAKSTLLGANIKPPASVFTPLKFGLKYNIAGPIYAEGQIGAAFEIRGRRTTRFVYSPGLVGNIDKFDLGVRYEGWAGNGGTISQVAVRLGYRL
ncbi:hypothetical protein ACFQZS_11225 [Mucilaginibacter calamicampi]|uniref:Outer membrane protein beta-barrel domain-containing protein n=1 Tax=Mucilaginibacter calamicampi TaxID=1302352 RepID=A0ABW2YY16_9SPHI